MRKRAFADMSRLADLAYYLVSEKARSVILVIFAAFFLSLTAFVHVETDDDLESGITVPEVLETLTKFKREFGNEQQILIAFPVDKIDQQAILGLWELNHKLKALPQINAVMSLLDILQPINQKERFIEYLQDFRIENLNELVQSNQLFSSPIIPFALIISLSEIIYLVSFFKRTHKNELRSYAVLHRENFYKLLRPCLINSITTLIGF